MAGDSRKRKTADETISEAGERISEELMIAKDNKRVLKSEAKRAKAKHQALLRDYNDGENASLKTDVEKSKVNIDQMDKDLIELDSELSSLKQQKIELEGGMDMGDGDNASGDDQERRDDIADDLMIARDNLKAVRTEAKKYHAKYITLLHDYNFGEKANLKDDVDRAKREVDQIDMDTLEAKAELDRLKNDLRESGGVPEDEAEDEVEKKLFVPEVKPPSKENPIIKVTGTGGVLEPSIEDDPEDLWSPEIARKKAGLAPDKFRVEGWRGGRSKTIIISRGPQNAYSFRFERESAAGVVVDVNNGDITLGRFGEEKDRNKKYVYGKQNTPIIQGVAWLTGGIEDPLSLLIPRPRPKPVPRGEVGPVKAPKVEMAIKLKWNIDGLKKKSWETRSTIRRLWGYETGDKYIYEAALEQESRHEEWKKGERQSMERSPTPGVVPKMPSPDPEVVDLTLKLPERPAAGKPIEEKKIKKEPTEKSAMLQYKEEWCEMKNIDIGDMDEEEDNAFIRAWRLEKAS